MNTLDLINWMAPKQMIQETRNVVQALAKFYKLRLSKGKDSITIQEEIELTLSYMQIQNMRFYNKLNLYIALDDQIGEYNIPKITLQPIVENAILHGILAKDNQEGTILIEGKMENNVITLSVKDDGIGITEKGSMSY
ncbi:histidine kinase [Paenibacillus sp. HWE-109]|uniref:sensor histidine kinase n=1 Tax=Paenibacillus sp. HWE-109 TaxID=1306526 RepID=UPI001EDE611C|nr:histidine kinase [Paenibacillus sp. HWE-109]UKS28264.1 histidine kinase [Paenibacillus sp. HWE-109]